MPVKVRNKDRLLKKLRALAPEIQTELEALGLKSAGEMASFAKSLVPVKTGALRDSIVVTPAGAKPPAHSQGGGNQVVPPGAVMVSAGNSGVRYAHIVEWGTAPFTSGGSFAGAPNPGVPPRPFFFPAYRLAKRRHKSRAGRAINKAVKRVAQR